MFFQKSCCIILLLLCVHIILSTDKPQTQRRVTTQKWRLLANENKNNKITGQKPQRHWVAEVLGEGPPSGPLIASPEPHPRSNAALCWTLKAPSLEEGQRVKVALEGDLKLLI